MLSRATGCRAPVRCQRMQAALTNHRPFHTPQRYQAQVRKTPFDALKGWNGPVLKLTANSQRLHSSTVGRAVPSTAASASSGPLPSGNPEKGGGQGVTLNTVITADGQKAYWLGPEAPATAKGVVLFLHGFAQSPKAYALLYQRLAAEGMLVVAPDPRPLVCVFPAVIQGVLVEGALYFHGLIWRNEFPPVTFSSNSVCQNVGLLGHSAGAGVATYIARKAAEARQPFRLVMFMAAQTETVDAYKPAAAVAAWSKQPSADAPRPQQFALLYGGQDWIASPGLSMDLAAQLCKLSKVAPDTLYPLGTHVGFQDQLFLADKEAYKLLSHPDAPLGFITVVSLFGLVLRLFLWCLGALLGLIASRILPRRGAPPPGVAAAGSGSADQLLADALAVAQAPGLSAGERALLWIQLAFAKEECKAYMQPLPRPPQAVKDTEHVTIPSYDESVSKYAQRLLLPTILACAASIGFTLRPQPPPGWSWCWPGSASWGCIALALGLAAAAGIHYLNGQKFVADVQRPGARAKAAEFFAALLASPPAEV